jgi:hypothetical protein
VVGDVRARGLPLRAEKCDRRGGERPTALTSPFRNVRNERRLPPFASSVTMASRTPEPVRDTPMS